MYLLGCINKYELSRKKIKASSLNLLVIERGQMSYIQILSPFQDTRFAIYFYSIF